MKLSLCMITKGEASLADAVASARPHVDEIVIVGTTPEAEAVARPLADVYETFLDANGPEGLDDFARARQRSFDLATGDAAMWMDSDDVLRGGEKLRELAATMPAGTAFVELPYVYESDEHGRPKLVQTRERLVRPIRAWRWQDPIHENLVTGAGRVHAGQTDGVVVWHQRKGPADSARNLRILERWSRAAPDNLRALFYLALGYFDAGRFSESLFAFQRFMLRNGASPDERAMAAMRMSWLHAREHDASEAIRWAEAALGERAWAECSFALARAWLVRASQTDNREDFERVIFYARAGLAAPPTKTRLWLNPMDRAAHIHAAINGVLAALGDTKGALDSVRQALEYMPDDPSLRSNELRYEAQLAREAAEAAETDIVRVAGKAERLFKDKIIRVDVRDVVESVLGVPMPTPLDCLDIVFACGDAWETWNPSTIDRHGIGGSEQAVANMAKQLAARGHRVRVYTNCGGAAHYDGVRWLPTNELQKGPSCDVLVAWREMRLLETARAKVRLAWAHDTELAGMSEWHAALADRVLVLSEWHRECLLQLHKELRPEQIVVTRNGIDPDLFAACDGVTRGSRCAIFSSSPTRGLPLLLDWWPRVRAVVPDALLRVAYGFETWEAMAQVRSDDKALAMIANLRERIANTEGVGLLGRVPPAQLAEHMSRAGVWLHPSWDTVNGREWFETSCIGAMEAQAAGCRVIATAVGALPETVGNGGILVDEQPTTTEGTQWWIDAIVSAMTSHTGWPDRKIAAATARRRFAWSDVAEQWEQLMTALLENSAKEAA